MTLAVSIATPHLLVERELLARGARVVVGMDEVGRGALAGPVSVGVVAVDVVLLDGKHDWLTPPAQAGFFEADFDADLAAASADTDATDAVARDRILDVVGLVDDATLADIDSYLRDFLSL
jgi:hypothetical protein